MGFRVLSTGSRVGLALTCFWLAASNRSSSSISSCTARRRFISSILVSFSEVNISSQREVFMSSVRQVLAESKVLRAVLRALRARALVASLRPVMPPWLRAVS
eukprot:CAMPEP_0182457184 /NCGR_PEP_ID=MMETSP1319-20130603/2817_1 /TAXON_ID=172717 /ORGANISM="Bolidomonas pacifica, Strain RCC208" /LENGTH=102 /DNA_ID=CAMNT_0024655597 /DNA_START=54 /DNA_END=362 /DNA_ORIENTATION=+